MAAASPPILADAFPSQASVFSSEIAGFWRRFGAFLIDTVLVGVALLIITLPFTGSLSRFGAYGRILGMFLAFPYFAILNSKIGSGQTLGKRWLNIRVADEAGKTISFARSTIRYAVLAIPYFLDDVVLPSTRTPSSVLILQSILGLLSFATIYLIIFNRRTRQGLHDLAAKSYVVFADFNAPPNIKSIWKPHWVILASILILGYAGGSFFARNSLRSIPFSQMYGDLRVVERMTDVQAASVVVQTTIGEDGTRTSLVFTINWTGNADDRSAFADQVAKTVISMDKTALHFDTIKIVLVQGYDLGFTHWRKSYYFQHSPAEWNAHWPDTPPPNQQPSKL